VAAEVTLAKKREPVRALINCLYKNWTPLYALANLAKETLMPIQANMHEAKSNLSQLADKAAEGETVIIAKAGKPYVQLMAIKGEARKPGAAKGKFTVPEDINAGDADITALFEGEK
jgi:antitoxin (DNA-binding transcriptional repressor) of toxin-antitoxin stability system